MYSSAWMNCFAPLLRPGKYVDNRVVYHWNGHLLSICKGASLIPKCWSGKSIFLLVQHLGTRLQGLAMYKYKELFVRYKEKSGGY